MNAQALDTMSQDWEPDIYQWSESSEAPEMQNQGESIQSDLFGSTGNILQDSGSPGPEDPDLFDWMDLNAPTPDVDNTLAVVDTSSIAIACTSDGSPPTISKRKKSKSICPTTLDTPSSSSVKEPDCRPESEICPIGKTAMCCGGEKEAWDRYYGFSVGGCIKCNLCFLPMLQSPIDLPLSLFSSNTKSLLDIEGENCRLSVCLTFNTLFCCDFLGMALMVCTYFLQIHPSKGEAKAS